MRTETTVAVMVLVVVFYAVLIGVKGVGVAAPAGRWSARCSGLALIVLPLLGLLLVWREIEFGRRTAALARALEAGGRAAGRRPAAPALGAGRPRGRGRAVRADADEAEAHPDDWRVWFRLALAYDAAGDRTRARAAARHAVALHG